MAKKLPDIDPYSYIPLRYEDRQRHIAVDGFDEGVKCLFRGRADKIEETETRSGKKNLVVSMIGDGGNFTVKFFHYSEFHLSKFKRGGELSLWGAPARDLRTWIFLQPRFIDEYGFIFPVYRKIKGIGEKRLREHIWDTVKREMNSSNNDEINALLSIRDLPAIGTALQMIHKPYNMPDTKPFMSLAYKEVFEIKKILSEEGRPAAPVLKADIEPFIESLPFKLTNDQINTVREIAADMSSGVSMRRLCIGDVGSGKTVVAQAATYITMQNGFRTLIMAPSTVLAAQHFRKFSEIFGQNNVGLCTGKVKEIDPLIIIGTHALLNSDFDNVGLVITDEQQRFGVNQRDILSTGEVHALQLSATPIPRTVSMIYHGALDITEIKTMPFKRNVQTKVVPKEHTSKILEHIKAEVQKGGKVLIVYPLVAEDSGEYKSVESSKEFWERSFPGKTLFVHGKSEDKDGIVEEFRTKQNRQILVATSIIETGIDVPEASLLVVAGAEKFGLCQLHQLRGRIGRKGAESFCYFIYKISDSEERLKPLETMQDGFQLAELDSDLRGWGSAMGEDQSGHMFKLPGLSIYKEAVQMVNQDIRAVSA